ncbi:MAG: 1,6-anhydro-N-acetylmuramyl-L-alanine amidase AmpD [Brachymonas sp.]|nr:1,6-anhydro-N-acetylmuramyl-L-alanine amidase AmpD [Brachymonas sp.]NJS35573.1 1,6-anhydro-N-acetylmuramyl-L-alanine amidase AmpD [Brachymonas sp.]
MQLPELTDSSPTVASSTGWLAGIAHEISPNFGSRPAGVLIDTVIVHSISLPPGQFGGMEVHDLFLNRLNWQAHPYYQQIQGIAVSAHFFIRRTGQVTQFVSCEDRAWHAGISHFQGRDNCNDFSIGIELEGLEGDAFEPAQYARLADLLQQLRQTYPIDYVVGHEHVAPGRKNDPGVGFDWRRLQATVAWPLQCFPVLSNLSQV